jgi:hypothetical protein
MGELSKIGPEDIQAVLPGHRDWQKERDAAAAKKVDRLMETWNKGLSGDPLFYARILIQCGLPVEIHESTEPVERVTKIGKDEEVRVVFSQRTRGVPLPYGKDRNMAIYLAHTSVTARSSLLDWKDINPYLTLFGNYERSGRNHRIAQERFIRIANMGITAYYTRMVNGEPQTRIEDISMVQGADIPGAIDELTGKWVTKQTPKQMLLRAESLRINPRFYELYLAPGASIYGKAVPIPVELVLQFADQPRDLDYALFLYWRCFAAQTESTISWEQLMRQFDSRDDAIRKWRYRFRQVVTRMRLMGSPFNLTEVLVGQKGIKLKPYPPGTAFFVDHPKGKIVPSSVAE